MYLNIFILQDLIVLLNGECAYEYRKRLGEELLRESQINADIVVPVPDSGVPAAIGYSQSSKIKFELGFDKKSLCGKNIY